MRNAQQTTAKDLTATELVDYAISNGMEYEYFTNIFDRWNDPTLEITRIGIQLKKHVWYWWHEITCDTVLQRDADGVLFSKRVHAPGMLFFDHRYNQANGAQQHGLHGVTAEMQIKEWMQSNQA